MMVIQVKRIFVSPLYAGYLTSSFRSRTAYKPLYPDVDVVRVVLLFFTEGWL